MAGTKEATRAGPARRVGRPRALGAPAGESPRDEILDAARRLFRENGFSGTSTREIARLAGLRQPTLFHYFPSKESILREVALGAVRPVLEFIGAEARERRPPDVALYRLIRFDTWHLCTNENALGSPFHLPEMTRDRLPEFWEQRDRIARRYRSLLREGARQGVFVVEDLGPVTQLLFALGESALELRQDLRRRRADKLATVTANLALRAVLTDPGRLAAVRRMAEQP